MPLLEKVVSDGRRLTRNIEQNHEPLPGAFFWLCAFYVVYCARPEDWIPGLTYLPLAKICGTCAFLALLFSVGRAKRSLRDLPPEGRYLVVLVCFLVLTSFFSPVWRGGAFNHSLGFAKVAVAWVLTFLVITNFRRLRQIILIQTASVAVIAVISILKGRNTPRLQGVLGGIYDNSNDLAFAMVLCLPFCLAFLLRGRGLMRKVMWLLAMLVMVTTVFLTASRAGFIELVITACFCLWYFAIKGKRPQLIVVSCLVGAVLTFGAGGKLEKRILALSGQITSDLDQRAYDSYEERKELMISSLKAIVHYPIYGIGVQNFVTYGGRWKEVHNCYLEIGAEGGITGLVLYLLFFRCAFANLKRLRKLDLDPEMKLFVWALQSSLIGFVTGALFAPEAYQFFSYFAVAQVSVIWAIVREQSPEALTALVPYERPRSFSWGSPRIESPANREWPASLSWDRRLPRPKELPVNLTS